MGGTPFDIFGAAAMTSPVILSIPHAGHDYARIAPMLRIPVSKLRTLEDRHADALAVAAIADGVATIIARAPRAEIDLNRAEEELDRLMVHRAPHDGAPPSARTRGGLGLIPRRISGAGELWRGQLSITELTRRIETIHRPYHAALADMIARARAAFGGVLLIDLHSMPPLAGDAAAEIVIGDRFGTTASGSLTAIAEAIAQADGFRTATNTPYAGGHLIARHAAPLRGIHALQIEVARDLYLDAALESHGPGLARIQRFVQRLGHALAAELVPPLPIAAE